VAFPVSSLISAFLLPQPLASLGNPQGTLHCSKCACAAAAAAAA
jgi:hypothetical protein